MGEPHCQRCMRENSKDGDLFTVVELSPGDSEECNRCGKEVLGGQYLFEKTGEQDEPEGYGE